MWLHLWAVSFLAGTIELSEIFQDTIMAIVIWNIILLVW